VRGLELSQRFDCNLEPAKFAEDDEILEYIGCPHAALHHADSLCAGWRSYAGSWQKPSTALVPKAVFAFWKAYAASADQCLAALGKWAMQMYSRPISSACCERIFSYLTHMDSSDRQTMGKETLANVLFLRGNWRVVHAMIDEEFAATVAARAARAKGVKRKRREDAEAAGAAAHQAAAAAAVAVQAAQAAAGAGGGGAGAGLGGGP
jgi:hypothetical protein